MAFSLVVKEFLIDFLFSCRVGKKQEHDLEGGSNVKVSYCFIHP